MRVFSFAQESTRYCNYGKDIENGITFIKPVWFDSNIDGQTCFLEACEEAESHYLWMVRGFKMKPQQARQVLPNALKTEINMCGFVSDWKHFFELRDSDAAHPDMRALAKPLHEEFIKRELL